MFSPKEQKIVYETLNKRLAWLKKVSSDANVDPNQKRDYLESFKLIESALKKIAASGPLKSPKPVVAPAAARPKRTVETASYLVAEDNEDSANLLMDVLTDIGAKNVILAKDGTEAFDQIKSSKTGFDIILCDWDMPMLTGIEVHQKAKASNTLRGAHFVMVTAVSESSRIRIAIQQGVNDYIVKPIDMDVLEGKIKVALGQEESES